MSAGEPAAHGRQNPAEKQVAERLAAPGFNHLGIAAPGVKWDRVFSTLMSQRRILVHSAAEH